jgi:hypothetical protein
MSAKDSEDYDAQLEEAGSERAFVRDTDGCAFLFAMKFMQTGMPDRLNGTSRVSAGEIPAFKK